MEPEDKFDEKYENFIVALEKYGSHGQVHMFGPENMYVSIPRRGIKDVYDEVDKIRMAAEEVGWSIPPEGDIEKSIMNDRRIAAEIAIIPAEEDLTGEYDESTKKFGKKFKESIDAADPALVCPYCGGNNCEVSIGNDDLNLTYLDRLQGETFNVECWCNDCNKPYNVTVELNVKDVYPNEDADMMDDHV